MKNNTIRISYYGLIFIVLLFGIIILKLLYVSYSKEVDGVNIKEFANNRNTTKTTVTAPRGDIYSTNGEILATNVNSYTVIAYLEESRTTDIKKPRHVIDKEYTANVLSEYINMSADTILSLLNTKAYQVELGPGGRDISERIKQKIESLELPGIDFISSSKRYYPYADFAPYIIGYTKKYDGVITGELGVEAYYDNELTGKDGYTIYQQDAYGYQIAGTPVIEKKAEGGNDIYLTIDSNIQMYLENAMKDLAASSSLEWAHVEVANAKTGAILGSASVPSYNPNTLNITNYNNPLVSYVYEPGSTMKIFSYMAAIDAGIYNGEELYTSGKLMIGNDFINDWNKVGWGNISYDVGFTYSSNVAAAKLGLTLKKDMLISYYKRFGFGSKTGIEIANEYSGRINPVYDLELANASFGQGLTTTPIQNIEALTSLVNGGVVVKPYIVEKVTKHGTNELIYEAERTEVGKAVSDEAVGKVLKLMYDTVNSDDPVATGRIYKTEGTTLAGKTGTAQIPSDKGGYETGTYNNIRSFAGVFPYEEPKYVIYISVKKMQGSSSLIAKEVKSIVESIAKYKNLDQLVVTDTTSKMVNIKNYINKDTTLSIEDLNNKGLNVIVIGNGNRVINQFPEKDSASIIGSKVFIETNSKEIYMPNMTGWSSSDVNNYCHLVGLNYQINGYGNVISQSIKEGEALDTNTILTLNLSKGIELGE